MIAKREGAILAITTMAVAGLLASAPGALAALVYEDFSCDDEETESVCKSAVCDDDGGNDDGLANVGEQVTCFMAFAAINNTDTEWTSVTAKDYLPAHFDFVFGDCFHEGGTIDDLDCSVTQQGGSDQERLTLTEASLSPGEAVYFLLDAASDETPGGEQSFDHCGYHDVNQGATLKYRVPKANGRGTRQVSASSGTLEQLCVLSADPDAEDCDGDMVNDSADADPCDPCVPDAGSDACLAL